MNLPPTAMHLSPAALELALTETTSSAAAARRSARRIRWNSRRPPPIVETARPKSWPVGWR
jgi:hypothetical protein